MTDSTNAGGAATEPTTETPYGEPESVGTGDDTIAFRIVDAAASPKPRQITEARTRRTTSAQSQTRPPLPPLRFRDLCALEDEGPAADWLWRGYLAPGVLTVLSGKPKGGKSTVTFNLLKALESGGEFLGQPAKAAKTVYLSEESPRSLRQKIARFGLQPGNIHVLTRRDAFPRRPFADVIAAAVEEARRFEAALLVVDTVACWSGLERDEEQDAGAMGQVAAVLQWAAAQGLAVLAIHHDRKGDGIGVDAMRGSSAFAASADLVLQFRAPKEGASERELRGWGRYDETPPGVRLAYDGTYRLGGALNDRSPDGRRRRVLAQLPSEGPGLTVQEVAGRLQADRHQVAGILEQTRLDGVVLRAGSGKKGRPWRFALNPEVMEVAA